MPKVWPPKISNVKTRVIQRHVTFSNLEEEKTDDAVEEQVDKMITERL